MHEKTPIEAWPHWKKLMDWLGDFHKRPLYRMWEPNVAPVLVFLLKPKLANEGRSANDGHLLLTYAGLCSIVCR